MKHQVIKHVLNNGLTVLIKPSPIIPKVSTHLWYDVGSKDEKTGEKGIAHLIEHMIFKGTEKLSECDINMISHKLSGYTNAFTSYDYTGYLFDFPSQHWHEALPIFADCMRNCTFKEEFLNSELKAVIQELKMYKDDYVRTLLELLVSSLFPDHPYHNPIIGYKHDLWSLSRDALVKFYNHHYVPNNATLIVVGDVNADDVLKRAEKEFGHIKPDKHYKREHYYHSPELKSQTLTIYREVTVPHVVLGWSIPGSSTGNDYLVNVVSWILGSGKGSRLYKKIVDQLQLATDLDSFVYELSDYGVFFIYFQPKELENIESIIEAIYEELIKLAENVALDADITRAIKKVEVDHLALLESIQKQAYAIGQFYLATGNEQFLYTYTDVPKDHLAYQVRDFIKAYLRPSVMHTASLLPLAEEDRTYWVEVQEVSDEEDARILRGRERTGVVEEARCSTTVKPQPAKPFVFPRAQQFTLSNGLRVLSCVQENVPKIDLIIDFEAKHDYDPVGKEGLGSFVAALILEGTKNYSAESLIDTIESYGMTLHASAGQIILSMLAGDLQKGLELLNEVICYPLFSQDSIEKVRAHILADLNEFWDSPNEFVGQLARQEIYKGHPYSKNILGTAEGVKNITRDDIVHFHKQYMSPKAARMALVGDFARYDIKALLEKAFTSWQGGSVEPLVYPAIEPIKKHQLNYPILRDQTVLCYAGLSVARMDPDFDKLLLFDQIFSGGVLHSMASRLFDLREQSGLFYTIKGSLISGVGQDKGMIQVKTIVSNDRLEEAEQAIKNVINTAIDTVTSDEFSEAQQAIINTLVDNFSSNYRIAGALLFKDKFKLPEDFYDKRAEQLSKITKEEMQHVVKNYLNTDKFVTIRVGRVS